MLKYIFVMPIYTNAITIHFLFQLHKVLWLHGHRQRGAGPPPWIFMHGTNVVDRGLKVLFSVFLLFFGLFPLALFWKRLNSAVFQSFLVFFGLFSVGPLLEIFLRTPLYGYTCLAEI